MTHATNPQFRCILCGGASYDGTQARDAKDGKPLGIALCTGCGMVQLERQIDDAALSDFYAGEYRETYRGSDRPKPRNVYKGGIKAARRLDVLLPSLTPGARLLDIGAGGGEFVYLAQKSGLNATGIDPNGAYVDFARSQYAIDLSRAEVADLPPDARFDVITMFHVLEHLAHPADVFAQVADLLTDGGLFVVEVPNFGSAELPPANTFFKAHIGYFTPETLAILAAGHFTVDRVDATKDLFMILRKAGTPRPVTAADRAQAVAVSRTRMAQRGTLNYLINGGALSLFRKAAHLMRMRRAVAGAEPRAILDTIASTITARTGA